MDDMQGTQKSDEKKVTLEFSRTTLWQVISGVLALVLVLSIFTGGFGFGNKNGNPTGGTVVNPPSAGNQPSVPTGPVDVSAAGNPQLGKDDAPVTVIEFSDFQCPFCQRFRQETFDQIKTNYIDTGKVKFVYRDFPLSSIHPFAQKAAEAAECANDEGKFWEYHDLLFEKQQEWASADESKFKDYAKDINLDPGKFDKCLDDDKYADEVKKDFQDGAQAGVQGTPSFFINGKQLSGAQPYPAFQAAIDAELK